MIKILGEEDVHANEDGRTHIVMPHNYTCDFESEVKDLPGLEVTAVGSFAFVIENGNLYGQTESGWKKVGG